MDNFQELLNNTDYMKVCNYATQPYNRTLDYDELKSCKMIGLWKASKKFNGRIKFTSYLYYCVKWECLRRIKENKRIGTKLEDIAAKPGIELHISFLPTDLQEIVTLRYIHKMTLTEIGKVYGFSYETARKKLKKAKELLRLKMVYNHID